MDAIALLTADHNRVRGLFARFREAQESDDQAAMAELADKICTELQVHTTIEEDDFYPPVRDASDELRETVDEGLQEHHVVDVLMSELGDLEAGSNDWVAKVTVIIENVEHHAGGRGEGDVPAGAEGLRCLDAAVARRQARDT